jgi:transcriptional regulator with XRE-family HTH domain
MTKSPSLDDGRHRRSEVQDERCTAGASDLTLGQLIQRLRLQAGLTQGELAQRIGTTQSGISRLEAGDGTSSRLDTLARVATAVDRLLVVSFPERGPAPPRDGVRITS